MFLSKYTVCGNKKSRFIKKYEASGLLNSFGKRTDLNKITILKWFSYSACEPFTKNREQIQIFKETGDSWYIY